MKVSANFQELLLPLRTDPQLARSRPRPWSFALVTALSGRVQSSFGLIGEGPNPLHRIECGPPKFFSKTFIFSLIFYSTWQISGGSHLRKACRSRKKELKPSEITCKQSEPARTISKIEKRKEFVRHCAMKDARRILSKGSTLLRGCWFGRKSFVFERISMGFSMRWRG